MQSVKHPTHRKATDDQLTIPHIQLRTIDFIVAEPNLQAGDERVGPRRIGCGNDWRQRVGELRVVLRISP
jgi:hypothetical protein